jgi:hypothetical protein
MTESKTEVTKIEESEVEAALNEIAQQRAESPEDMFAFTYSSLLPRFNAIMNGLGAKGKTRVVNILMQHPLQPNSMRVISQDEMNAVRLGLQILEAKYAMVLFQQLSTIGLTEPKTQEE